jgi:type II secretory pathway pseudopilin PulG
MVVVIGIMALLLAIAAPIFQNMAGGQGVRSAARLTCQKLKLARAYAINNREYVAILFPEETSGLSMDYKYRSYRACIVKSGTGGDYAFKRWIPGEGWTKLPGTVSAVGINTTKTSPEKGKKSDFLGAEKVTNVPCSEIGGSATGDELKAIVFKPTGMAAGISYLVLADDVMENAKRVKGKIEKDLFVRVDQYTGHVTFEE